jgi:hypothetical protein
MGFPIGIEGTISLHEYGISPAQVAGQIREMLEAAQASEISVRGSEVLFKKSLLRPRWRTTVLLPFDSGRFTIETPDGGLAVRYRLSTRRNTRIVTALIGVFGAVSAVPLGISAMSGTGLQELPEDVLATVLSLAAMWLWLAGLNYLMAKIRTPFWLRSELLR